MPESRRQKGQLPRTPPSVPPDAGLGPGERLVGAIRARAFKRNNPLIAGQIGKRTPAGARESRPARVPEGPARIVIVSADAAWRRRVAQALAGRGVVVEAAASGRAGGAALTGTTENTGGAARPCVLVIDVELPDGPGLALAEAACRAGVGTVMVSGSANVDDAVAAMRAGASDLLSPAMDTGETAERIMSVAARTLETRRGENRMVRLERMCGRLRSARGLVARQVDSLCTDLTTAYQELLDQMNRVTIATEFNGLIRQELDVESLLRTTLEFVLSKSGPTNAAVFLPTTSGDFSLGAYVNYDCPKDTVDILLDHMANVIAPRFETVGEVTHLTEKKSLDRYLANDAEWMGDAHVIGFACRHDGETLAIFLLFRDRKNPYTETLVQQLATVRDLFGAQLARVIKIHHRHLPKNKWGALGDGEDSQDDTGGMAA